MPRQGRGSFGAFPFAFVWPQLLPSRLPSSCASRATLTAMRRFPSFVSPSHHGGVDVPYTAGPKPITGEASVH
jgi:hypothetical protein